MLFSEKMFIDKGRNHALLDEAKIKQIEDWMTQLLECLYGINKNADMQLVYLRGQCWELKSDEDTEVAGSLWDLEKWMQEHCSQYVPGENRISKIDLLVFEKKIERIVESYPSSVELYFDVCGKYRGWGYLCDGEIYYDESVDDYLFALDEIGDKLKSCDQCFLA